MRAIVDPSRQAPAARGPARRRRPPNERTPRGRGGAVSGRGGVPPSGSYFAACLATMSFSIFLYSDSGTIFLAFRVALRLVGAAVDDLLRVGVADARQRRQLLLGGRVDVHEAASPLRRASRGPRTDWASAGFDACGRTAARTTARRARRRARRRRRARSRTDASWLPHVVCPFLMRSHGAPIRERPACDLGHRADTHAGIKKRAGPPSAALTESRGRNCAVASQTGCGGRGRTATAEAFAASADAGRSGRRADLTRRGHAVHHQRAMTIPVNRQSIVRPGAASIAGPAVVALAVPAGRE